MERKKTSETDPARYYDAKGILPEIVQEPVEFALDHALKEQILAGARTRKLKNVRLSRRGGGARRRVLESDTARGSFPRRSRFESRTVAARQPGQDP